jgi:hypothetical protein
MPRPELVEPSYKVGVADGRLQAIEESMDAVAALIVKAETMLASFGPEVAPAKRDSGEQFLRALYLAFAAVTGSANGSPAFTSLLEESKARLAGRDSRVH